MGNSTIADTANGSPDLDFSSPYGYTPTSWICILFVVLYSVTALFHLAQAVLSSLWWMIPTVVLCGLFEIIGWSGRLWSSYNAQDMDHFLIQLTIAIIAPSFLTGAVFNILGLTIRRVGTQYSRLPPRWYLIVFMSLDLASLVIQVIGGGKASIAAHHGNDPEPGGKIMMYGVTIQMVGITIFCILGVNFLLRVYWNKPLRSSFHSSQINSDATYSTFTSSETTIRTFPTKVRLMLLGAGITTVWVLTRSIYRIIELANGWTEQIMTNQAYFNVLDGAPIILAMFTLNIFHPGWLLREESRSDSLKLDTMDGSYSTTGTSEVGGEEYVLDIVRPKDTYILPLKLDLGWTLNVDDLWKLVATIEHQHPPSLTTL